MRRKVYSIILIWVIAFIFTACSIQQKTEIVESKQTSTPTPITTISIDKILPYEQLNLQEDFQEKAFEHVSNITNFGIREVGSDAEASTIDYIMNYLGESGIEAQKEEFKFQYYNLEKVLINETEVDCDKLYFNP